MDSAPEVPILQTVALSKRYGGAVAIDNVSLSIRQGEVHAFVGENGAGKSTLSNMIAGLVTPDSGELLLRGEPVTFGSPRDALAHGIAAIAQELALVPKLTVAQNVYLGTEPRRWGFVRRRALARRFTDLAKRTGFELGGSEITGALRTADQQKVEIMRALSRDTSVIIMDEPTASLSRDDASRLHEVIRGLAAEGRTVVFISHFLGEVLELADTVSVLRDGRLVRSGPTKNETESSLIEAMLGRSLGSIFPAKPPLPEANSEPVLQVESLSAPGVRNVSLTVRPGEIVGLAGLVGAGRTELAQAIFGATRRSDGSVAVAGSASALANPAAALRAGVFLIPESRKDSGLLPDRSVAENITVAALRECSRLAIVRPRAQREAARDLVDRVGIRTRHVREPIRTLSGGNQQKVLFARSLMCGPKLLIADEPTRGVDVGSRHAIYELIAEQARAGLGVLVISSDVEEVLGLAHRVVVMSGGRVSAELAGEQMTEHNVLVAAFRDTAHDTLEAPA